MGDFAERTIATVLGDIVGNLREMVRAEIRLAKVEAKTELSKTARGAVMVAAGAAVAMVALGFAGLTAMYLLATVVAPWAAALIVAGVSLAIAGILVAVGLKRLRTINLSLPKTTATIKENIEWAKPSTR